MAQMCMFVCVILSLLSCHFSLPVSNTFHPDANNPSVTNHDNQVDKKGTIRIAGPWHSDSALDRNVDAGEDSYVKKIISSNEGINFNKDIAEAGEMFDVNGIEDFYDKNAMITYEINGHEIPVHMRPKLTPQSKSLFPEYMKDSPSSMGLVRGTSKHPASGRSPAAAAISGLKKNPVSREMSMFSGASLSDMPEYKTGTAVRLANLDSGRTKKVNTIQAYTKSKHTSDNKPSEGASSTENSARVYKSPIATNSEVLSSRMVSQHQKQVPDVSTRDYRNPVSLDAIHNPVEQQEERGSQPGVNDIMHSDNEHQITSENTVRNNNIDPVQHASEAGLVQNYGNRIVEKTENSAVRERQSSDYTGQKYEVPTTNIIPEKQAISRENGVESSEKKMNTEDVLFKQLESLHHNLEKDKLANEADMKSVSEDRSVDPKKVKAKERILNLLGTLTDKLKGMESIVSGGNRDKPIEKFISDTSNQVNQAISDASRVKEAPSHSESNKLYGETGQEPVEALAQHENYMYSNHDSDAPESEDKPGKDQTLALLSPPQVKANSPEQQIVEDSSPDLRNSPQYGQEETTPFSNNEEEENAKEQEDGGRSMLMKTFGKISDESPLQMHHVTAEESKHQSEVIQKFREHDKPFVMNTNAIDFKPNQNTGADDYTDDDDNENGAENARFHDNRNEDEEIVKLPKHAAAFLKRKHGEDVEADSRQTLSHIRKNHHRHNDAEPSNFVDTDKVENSDDDDSEEEYDDNNEAKNQHRSRNHKKHHRRHQYHNHNKDDDNDDVDEELTSSVKHHKQRHHLSSKFAADKEDQNADDSDDDEKVGGASSKKLTAHGHRSSEDNRQEVEELDIEENAKMNAVEEDLASADEKRERTDNRPNAREDVEFPDYNDVKEAAIFETNLLRKRFHAKPIHWSDKLSDRAQVEAEKLAKQIDLNEKTVSAYKVPGEDVALVSLNSTNVGKDAPDLWARGSKFYDFRSPQISGKNLDFAQMMWKAGNEFGLGVAKTKLENNWIVTSMFDAPVVDRFKDLKLNLESDIPIEDPYSDIVG